MQIELAYGKERLKVDIPDGIHTEVVQPGYVKGLADQAGSIREALQNPIDHAPLSESINEKQRVAIIFSDITRATPYHIILPPLLEKLAHLPDENITFFCATGTHRPATPEELLTILGQEVTKRFQIVQNNAGDSSAAKVWWGPHLPEIKSCSTARSLNMT